MFKSVAVVVLWMLVALSANFAQGRSADTRFGQATPGNCEVNAAELDSVRNEALGDTNKDSIVIVIARLGNGETTRVHNHRRLLALKNYLSKYDLPTQRVVTAEGERADGYGRVELYVAGKLRGVLLADRNKPLCVECCDPDDADFYPYRNSKKQPR